VYNTTAGYSTVNISENIFYTGSEYDYTNQSGISRDQGVNEFVTNSNYSNSIVPLYFNINNGSTPTTEEPYIDPDLGYVRCAYDLRLRQIGKKYYPTDENTMLMDSPLLGLYSGDDLNPWEETLTEGSIVYADLIEIIYPASQLLVTYVPKNPVELYDMHGNPKIDFDSRRKEFTFDFQNYVSNNQIWALNRIFESKKPKRLYPIGVGKSFISASAGTLSGGVFTPSGLSMSLPPYHWVGFWITLEDSYGTYDYYISANDETSFTLIDKLGIGMLPDDDYTFTIEYILVQTKTEDFKFTQQYFTDFTQGGAWDETGYTLPFEYGNTKITLVETENPL
jgi:hypothetical protein